MNSSHHVTPPRRWSAISGATALALSFALIAAPAAAQDTAGAAKPDSAKAAAQAAAQLDACNKLKAYAKQVVTDSIKASWKAGTLFRGDDSTSKQMQPQMPRMSFDSASVPDSVRTIATTAGSSCRAAPNSQAMMQLVQVQLSAPRPLIGVQFQPLTPKDTAGFGLSNTRGLLVTAVTSGMGAANAGVTKGDIMVGLDDKPLTTINQFMQRASQWKDGQTIKLEVVHPGGKHQTMDIKTKTNK
jgi:C-terminal processing protease CtpA/Prc